MTSQLNVALILKLQALADVQSTGAGIKCLHYSGGILLMVHFPWFEHRSVEEPLGRPMVDCHRHSTMGQPCFYHDTWLLRSSYVAMPRLTPFFHWLNSHVSTMMCGYYMVVMWKALDYVVSMWY